MPLCGKVGQDQDFITTHKGMKFLIWQEIVMDCLKKNGCSHQQLI